MKITTDVSDIMPKRPRSANQSVKSSSNVKKIQQNRLVDQQLQKSISSKLNNEKALGDALSVAQMSRSIIHKAMTISSRLNSIATEAVRTGSINNTEVNEAVSEIQSSMGSLGESITAPAQTLNNSNVEIPEIVPINNEISTMNSIAENMERGRIPEVKEIETLINNINQKSDSIGKAIEQIEGSMTEILSEYSVNSNSDFSQMGKRATEAILGSPDAALLSQANISHEIANRLFQ